MVCNFLEYVWSHGGEVFDEDGNVVINSDEAVESLQFMKDIIHKYKITPPGVVTYKEEEARRLFTEGLESVKFVKFITSYEIQKLFAIKVGRLPTRKKVYEDREVLSINLHYRDLYEVFVSVRPRPVPPYYTQLSDILQIEVHRSLIGKKSPTEALDSAKEKIEQVLYPPFLRRYLQKLRRQQSLMAALLFKL